MQRPMTSPYSHITPYDNEADVTADECTHSEILATAQSLARDVFGTRHFADVLEAKLRRIESKRERIQDIGLYNDVGIWIEHINEWRSECSNNAEWVAFVTVTNSDHLEGLGT